MCDMFLSRLQTQYYYDSLLPGRHPADRFPLGSVSEAIVYDLPRKVDRFLAGKLKPAELETFTDKILKDSLFKKLLENFCEGKEPDRAKRALLDLALLDAALFHCGAKENAVLTDSLNRLSQVLGRPNMLTYEMITILNPAQETRGFLSGKTGMVEREFYQRHASIELHLAKTLEELRKAREHLLKAPPSQAETVETLMAARSEYRKVLTHLNEFFVPLDGAAFGAFRRFNSGVRGAPGPSGLYSANTYAVQLAIFGDTVAKRVLSLLEKKHLLPVDCLPDLESEYKASLNGLSLLRLCQKPNTHNLIKELVAQLMTDQIEASNLHRQVFARLVPPTETEEQRGTGGVYNPHKYLYGGFNMLVQGYQEFLWQPRAASLVRPEVEQVKLSEDYSVSRIIRGAWQLAGGHGTVKREAALRDLRAYARAGIAIDCADIYTGVESLIGEALSELEPKLRPKVHTKFVPDLDKLESLSPEYIAECVAGSLERLSVSALDLVQMHWWDFSVPGHVEAALELTRLKQLGLIRNIGVTNYDGQHLLELIDAGVPVISNQVQYSLLDRRPEKSLLAISRSHKIKLLCYGSVAGGFLTERYLDLPEGEATLENRSLIKYRLIIDEIGGWDKFQEILGAVNQVAHKHGVSMASVASRYIMERDGVASVVIGSRNEDQLERNLEVFSFVLDREDYTLIERILARVTQVPGEVYELERDRKGRHGAIMRYNLLSGAN